MTKGGVIQIGISWNCDYDPWGWCGPKYSFSRFDLPYKETQTANGFNFRYLQFEKKSLSLNNIYDYYKICK